MGRSETCFYHPGMRRIAPADVENEKVTSLLGTWVRVVLTDQRAFVGSLKAIDDSCNVVLMNAVEVRPVTHRPGEEERKGHRGYVMISECLCCVPVFVV
jgi:small nuclear ribonucleoprotein (snRNP)-like protein